ncbi:aminotransferase class I/II-fold pyridoxal phosphate-dependent enzyme [Rhizobium sp. FKL33]|uniref:DegT/DnrJ/EryC1/StrS family aminotransferase n=1 Tax=Rhizobium sp. FKL33 TaxID=2562307 RepID=UPI0010BF6D8E|nr:aminotransferase class I/II-fold pyridoxal phosphate-dependent enzyme [Rhizobium sp. FKL33]
MSNLPELLDQRAAASSINWDYREYYRDWQVDVVESIALALQEPVMSIGPRVEQFEESCAAFMGGSYAVAFSSCTTGLVLSVAAAAKEGVVLMPSLSFVATVLCGIWNSLPVEFLKVDEGTLNLSPSALIERLKEGAVGAVVFVAVAGSLAGLDEIHAIANAHGIPVIVDGAGSLGSTISGKAAVEFCDVIVVSFASKKILPIGEGGMAFTRHANVADALRTLRRYGSTDGYTAVSRGLNGRMSEVHAAIGLAQLPGLPGVLRRRRDFVRELRQATPEGRGFRWQRTGQPSANSFTDLVGVIEFGRNDVVAELRGMGLDAFQYYDPPAPLHPAYSGKGFLPLGLDEMRQVDDLPGKLFAFRPVSSFDVKHVQVVGSVINRVLRHHDQAYRLS